MTKVKAHERVDYIDRKDYKIIQNPQVFCFGIDAVLLADFAKAKSQDKVLDIGTGTGIIPILMYARYENPGYLGIDIQEDMIHMANRSLNLNGIEKAIKFKFLNVKDIENSLEAESFDLVTSNPPYMRADSGIVNSNYAKMVARHEVECTLEDIIQNAAYVLKNAGKLYMIHRPNRLVDIMVLMRKYKLEPKRMRLVHPRKGKAPTMVLVEGRKNARSDLYVEDPLYVYKDDKYTDEINKIYGRKKE